VANLEDLKPGIQVDDILPNQSVALIDVQGHGRSVLEGKGRTVGTETATITRNETLNRLNALNQYFLTLVEVEDGQVASSQYVKRTRIHGARSLRSRRMNPC
jgi:hypothetical protein